MDTSTSKPRTSRNTAKPGLVISEGEGRPNGSQAIRRRVAQLLQGQTPISTSSSQSNGVTLDSPEDWHPLSTHPPPHTHSYPRTALAHSNATRAVVDTPPGSSRPLKATNPVVHPSRVDPSATKQTRVHVKTVEAGKTSTARHIPMTEAPLASSRRLVVDDHAISVEIDKLKQEVELLKASLQEARRVARREAKKLLEAKAELSSTQITVIEKERELSETKAKGRANEELLNTIEASIQCQICMELPENPFSLSPCGHILCLSCLQEWFRKAPSSLDDMDIDPEELTDPAFVLARKKTCPSCRTVVKHRPAPAFMVKSVVTTLKKARTPSAAASTSNLQEADTHPWKGIFPSSDEEEPAEEGYSSGDSLGSDVSTDGRFLRPHFFRIGTRTFLTQRPYVPSDSENEDEGDEGEDEEPFVEDEDSDAEFHDVDSDHGRSHTAHHGSDDDDDEGGASEGEEYAQPRWAPPQAPTAPFYEANHTEGRVAELSRMTRKLLSRGCTREMLARYHVAYDHARGIIVSVLSLDDLYPSRVDDEDRFWVSLDQLEPMNRLYLGWNISLSPGDRDGSQFLGEMLREIKDMPQRWQLRAGRPPRGVDAVRLFRRHEVYEMFYETSDSEFYVETDDFYLD